MKIPVYQIDAFTQAPFSGNPAAVCPLDEWIPENVMQSIAAEMNLSETAFFVRKPGAGNNSLETEEGKNRAEYDLRWFTPLVEVELCGHATLASAHVVFNNLEIQLDRVAFHTQSGRLGVSRRDDLLELDFPANLPVETSDPAEIAAVSSALGADPAAVLSANTTVAVFDTQGEVAALDPDFPAVAGLNKPWVVATAPADAEGIDFVSRFFAPTAGINEDPATGSTHTILMPYWAERLGRNQLVAHQISKRGGVFYCEVVGDRVKIAGHTVEVMTGKLDFQI